MKHLAQSVRSTLQQWLANQEGGQHITPKPLHATLAVKQICNTEAV
jgi:hypothetical protein